MTFAISGGKNPATCENIGATSKLTNEVVTIVLRTDRNLFLLLSSITVITAVMLENDMFRISGNR